MANNLTGYMQYLDLIRDCIELFSLEPMPPNEVETQHPFKSHVSCSYAYAGEDNRHHRTHGASEKFDLTERNNRLLAQGRKRRSKRAEHPSEPEDSGSATDMTQLLQESLLTSETNSSSQIPLEQSSNEEDSSLVDSAPGSEE